MRNQFIFVSDYCLLTHPETIHLNFSCKYSCTHRYKHLFTTALEARTDPINYQLLILFFLDAGLYFNFSMDVLRL